MNASDASEDQRESDVQKHDKELQKELGKKVINWKEVVEDGTVSEITGVNAVEKVLEQFPFFEHERVVSSYGVSRSFYAHQ